MPGLRTFFLVDEPICSEGALHSPALAVRPEESHGILLSSTHDDVSGRRGAPDETKKRAEVLYCSMTGEKEARNGALKGLIQQG
jgi:hypothetical protein